MIWQDLVIMISVFGFAVALIPSIIARQKPQDSSCIITIVLLSVMAICFATLGLWLSFVAQIVSILAWIIMLIRGK